MQRSVKRKTQIHLNSDAFAAVVTRDHTMEHFSTHFIMIDNVLEPQHIMVVVQELDTSGFNLIDTILTKIQIVDTVLREVLRRPFDGAVGSR